MGNVGFPLGVKGLDLKANHLPQLVPRSRELARTSYSGVLGRVALVRTDVSEEFIASIIE
jgi:hypothetical protein